MLLPRVRLLTAPASRWYVKYFVLHSKKVRILSQTTDPFYITRPFIHKQHITYHRLLRAVETAVKIVPDLAIPTLLARSVRRQGMSMSGTHGNAQCELLQRVARQALSKEQCDSLIYHICAPAPSTATPVDYGGSSSSMGQPLGTGTYITGLFFISSYPR